MSLSCWLSAWTHQAALGLTCTGYVTLLYLWLALACTAHLLWCPCQPLTDPCLCSNLPAASAPVLSMSLLPRAPQFSSSLFFPKECLAVSHTSMSTHSPLNSLHPKHFIGSTLAHRFIHWCLWSLCFVCSWGSPFGVKTQGFLPDAFRRLWRKWKFPNT